MEACELNTHMRFNEFNDVLQRVTATVRVVNKTSSITAKTLIYAESPMHGRAMLERLYGAGNVLSISQPVQEEGTKVLSPDELRVKAVADQAKRLNQQAKQMRAQNAMKKAQVRLTNLSANTPSRNGSSSGLNAQMN